VQHHIHDADDLSPACRQIRTDPGCSGHGLSIRLTRKGNTECADFIAHESKRPSFAAGAADRDGEPIELSDQRGIVSMTRTRSGS
jgi:hypothetical protein